MAIIIILKHIAMITCKIQKRNRGKYRKKKHFCTYLFALHAILNLLLLQNDLDLTSKQIQFRAGRTKN